MGTGSGTNRIRPDKVARVPEIYPCEDRKQFARYSARGITPSWELRLHHGEGPDVRTKPTATIQHLSPEVFGRRSIRRTVLKSL